MRILKTNINKLKNVFHISRFEYFIYYTVIQQNNWEKNNFRNFIFIKESPTHEKGDGSPTDDDKHTTDEEFDDESDVEIDVEKDENGK